VIGRLVKAASQQIDM